MGSSLPADASYRPEVWSVDTEPYWLEQTREFLRAKEISDDSLITWDNFCSEERGRFELVLHDLGHTDVRIATLEHVMRLAQPETGLVILDDIHRSGYRAHVARTVEQMGSIDYYSLRVYTLDKFGRYSGLLMGRDRETGKPLPNTLRHFGLENTIPESWER